MITPREQRRPHPQAVPISKGGISAKYRSITLTMKIEKVWKPFSTLSNPLAVDLSSLYLGTVAFTYTIPRRTFILLQVYQFQTYVSGVFNSSGIVYQIMENGGRKSGRAK